jgi:LDH2 family malate/lactate/ureidoglycolate dehydrogenase
MTTTSAAAVPDVTAFVASLLERAGMRTDDAALCAGAFVLQEMRGVTTHGLRRVPSMAEGLLAGRLKADARYEVLNDDGATVLLDGHGGLGIVACMAAMDRAVEKARTFGIGIATVRNNTHFLAAAPYCLRAVEADIIGICMSNSYGAMAYPGTTQKTLGNAPMGYAIPGDAFPLVFDAALTVSAGKLQQWQRDGVPIPDGLQGLDAEGNLTNDPSEVLQGVTLPIGLHKGAGLTIMVEMLSGMLAGGTFVHGGRPEDAQYEMDTYSQCCIAIDPARFLPLDEVKRRVAAYVAAIKLRPVAPGHNELLAPGERAHRAYEAARLHGIVPEDDVRDSLIGIASRLGVASPFAPYM